MRSQNLIPNSGFDLVTDCPNSEGLIELAAPWVNCSNSQGSVFNKCSDNVYCNVPSAGNYLNSYQTPRSGDGYGHFLAYREANYRSIAYIGVPLKNRMVKGIQYFIEFYVSPDVNPIDYWIYIDAVGLALTEDYYFEELVAHTSLSIEPVIENRGMLITDTLGWTRICGSYIGKGNEGFAVLGNFRNTAETNIEVENPDITPYQMFFYVDDVQIIPFNPLPDTILWCHDEVMILNASFLDATYLWNDGNTGNELVVNNPGIYRVIAKIEDNEFIDSVLVIKMPENIPTYIDTTLCSNSTITLEAPIYGEYLWNDGSNNKINSISESGLYSVSVTNNCGSFTYDYNVNNKECECNLYTPNIFSPNNDGIDDFFEVFIKCDWDFEILNFQIYDRWGNKILDENQTKNIVWDGKVNSQMASLDVYTWKLVYRIFKQEKEEVITMTGSITSIK